MEMEPPTVDRAGGLGWKLRLGPDGAHFFNRESGLNVLLDEVDVPSDRWSKAPRHVSIALLNACDLACHFCYAPKHKAILSADTVLAWARELCEGDALGLGFGGGEPTLYPNFPQLCRAIASETGLAVTFTTHGHRLDRAMAAELRGAVHLIRVSMDGVGATYERLRGRPFSGLLRALELAADTAKLGINFVVNAATLPDLPGAYEVATTFGAEEFLLLPEQPTPGGSGIDAMTFAQLRAFVSEKGGPCRLLVTEGSEEGFPVCMPFTEERGARAYAHIDASGMLKRSSYSKFGVMISSEGVLAALEALRQQEDST